MSWNEFHHPDISWPVISRKVGLEFMELLELTALFLTKGGWGLIKQNCYPSNAAYRTALSRLRKQGLVVRRESEVGVPQLGLTDSGRQCLPVYFNPLQHWNRPWKRIWYMLIYDVPEADRKYRNILRQFLLKKRMGCLQKSVWVTPEDIRPDFADLTQAANLDAFAYLFESRTVLGLPSRRVVEDAWDFNRLGKIQGHYCSVMDKNLELLMEGTHSPSDLLTLLRLSVEGYHAAMEKDPLLPEGLHPKGYLGKQVYAMHKKLLQEANQQMLHSN